MTIAVGRRGSRGKGRHHGGGYWGWNKPRNFCQTTLGQTCNTGEYYFEQIIADADLCNRQCPPLPYKTCRNNDNSPNRICINQVRSLIIEFLVIIEIFFRLAIWLALLSVLTVKAGNLESGTWVDVIFVAWAAKTTFLPHVLVSKPGILK